jgi:hypothetical protein
MPNWAIIKDNKIIDCIIADSKEIAEEITGLEAIDDEGWISIGFEKFEESWRNPYPNDGKEYIWNIELKGWELVNPEI